MSLVLCIAPPPPGGRLDSSSFRQLDQARPQPTVDTFVTHFVHAQGTVFVSMPPRRVDSSGQVHLAVSQVLRDQLRDVIQETTDSFLTPHRRSGFDTDPSDPSRVVFRHVSRFSLGTADGASGRIYIEVPAPHAQSISECVLIMPLHNRRVELLMNCPEQMETWYGSYCDRTGQTPLPMSTWLPDPLLTHELRRPIRMRARAECEEPQDDVEEEEEDTSRARNMVPPSSVDAAVWETVPSTTAQAKSACSPPSTHVIRIPGTSLTLTPYTGEAEQNDEDTM